MNILFKLDSDLMGLINNLPIENFMNEFRVNVAQKSSLSKSSQILKNKKDGIVSLYEITLGNCCYLETKKVLIFQ